MWMEYNPNNIVEIKSTINDIDFKEQEEKHGIQVNNNNDNNVSYQYIKRRLTEDNQKSNHLTSIEFTQIFRFIDEDTSINIVERDINFDNSVYKLIVRYNPILSPQYYSSSFIRNDGTLMFMETAINEVFKKVVNLETCYRPFQDKLQDTTKSKIIIYEVGDFIVNTYYDEEGAPEDKKWMSCIFQGCLPINMKIEVIE